MRASDHWRYWAACSAQLILRRSTRRFSLTHSAPPSTSIQQHPAASSSIQLFSFSTLNCELLFFFFFFFILLLLLVCYQLLYSGVNRYGCVIQHLRGLVFDWGSFSSKFWRFFRSGLVEIWMFLGFASKFQFLGLKVVKSLVFRGEKCVNSLVLRSKFAKNLVQRSKYVNILVIRSKFSRF